MKNKNCLCRGFLLLTCVCILICGLAGCQKEEELIITNDTGTTMGNIAMGRGCFAYQNGLLYFSDPETIFEYDMESGKTVFFPANTVDPNNLHITQNHIIVAGFDENYKECAMAITKDGKKTSTVFEPSVGAYCLYLNEKEAYYLSAMGGDLFHRDMETDVETKLLEKIQSYYLSDGHLYVTQNVDEKYVLKARAHGENDFYEIPLSFEPIQVLAGDNELFLQQKKPYQIVRYCGGEETLLPIHSVKYQYLNGKLIYSDDKTFKNSSWTVKSYVLVTGAEQVLCEGVFEFGVFEEGFAVFWCRTETGSVWKIFDFETNELKQIYPSA